MATCHGGTGQPLERNDTPHGKDTEVNIPHDYHQEHTDDFETIEQENHTTLANLTWELDDLCHKVQAGKGQPMEALHQIECKLQKLSITLHPSAPPEPHDDVLQQYTETLCSV